LGYHGVLVPNAGFRRLVVPGRSVSPVELFTVSSSGRQLDWVALLARVFAYCGDLPDLLHLE